MQVNNNPTMPIQEKTLKEAISEAEKKLQGLLIALNTFKFPESSSKRFSANSIDVDEIVKDIPVASESDDFIYFFKVVGQNKKSSEFWNKLSTEREKQREDEDKKEALLKSEWVNNSILVFICGVSGYLLAHHRRLA